MITRDEILMAGKHYGMDMSKLVVRLQEILTLMYQYGQGWLSERSLEVKMENVFKKGPPMISGIDNSVPKRGV